MYHFNPFPEHCRVVHITEQIDFTSESGYQYVLDLIGRTENVMMSVSFPCTGGCLCNVGINSKRPECKAKLRRHAVIFNKLWKQFARLYAEAGRRTPTVIEWPKSCRYLVLRKVKNLMDEQRIFKVEFDGCQYGLKSIRRGMEDHFKKKPWAFATDMFEVAPTFQNTCKGISETHKHDTCNSKNAIHSQYYTPIIVTLLHHAVMEHLSLIHI